MLLQVELDSLSGAALGIQDWLERCKEVVGQFGRWEQVYETRLSLVDTLEQTTSYHQWNQWRLHFCHKGQLQNTSF